MFCARRDCLCTSGSARAATLPPLAVSCGGSRESLRCRNETLACRLLRLAVVQQIFAPLVGKGFEAHPAAGCFLGGPRLKLGERVNLAGVRFDFLFDESPVLFHDRSELLPIE